MNTITDDNLAKSLKSLYDSDESSRAVLDWFAGRKNGGKITVRVAALNANIEYRATFEVFRKLENLGCGDLIAGRRGHETRMEFVYSLQSLGAAAKGGNQKPIAVDAAKIVVEDDFTDEVAVEHSYKLRSDFEVVLKLPEDFNPREAERLSNYIKTLPFGE